MTSDNLIHWLEGFIQNKDVLSVPEVATLKAKIEDYRKNQNLVDIKSPTLPPNYIQVHNPVDTGFRYSPNTCEA
jgi:hypothetical protein